MRQKGKIKSWNDERGFGFVVPGDGGKAVFLHISAFSNRVRRPEVGQTLTYTLTADSQGRPTAGKARLPGDRLPVRKRRTGAFGAVIVAGVFLALLFFLALAGKIPQVFLWGYLGVSLITFLVYALDKLAAKKGAWRTSEKTLHWLSIAGGWPGALIAQQTLRHKSKKQPFRSVFWVTTALNLAIFASLFTPTGSETIESWIASGKSLIGSEERPMIEWAEP